LKRDNMTSSFILACEVVKQYELRPHVKTKVLPGGNAAQFDTEALRAAEPPAQKTPVVYISAYINVILHGSIHLTIHIQGTFYL
jgi:hypothetical protein